MDRNEFGKFAFISGHESQNPEPLSRFLPQISDGIITSWLNQTIPPGSWILDPFCSSPKIALEAARTGYKVLVAVNNPIVRFILELLANPPSTSELQSALATLSSSFVGNERLEPHIRSLYNTLCARCGQVVSADEYLWTHDSLSPYARIYTCPNCGDSGEHPSIAYDVENAGRISANAMYKARALERVIASNDPDRNHVEQALSIYNPRSLYALITIINKFDGLNLSAEGSRNLSALLLYVFDQANSMWKVSGQREKPRQLTVPRVYREANVWSVLEHAIDKWSTHQSSSIINLTYWPDVPPESGGICLYEGRFGSIAETVKVYDVKAVCTSLPRPNQAFWTLSALWAGWLWGREAITHFKSVFHRQRYDWAWHTSALASVYMQLVSSLRQSTPIFGLMSDAEPGFITSALISACMSGCNLESISMRPEQEYAQLAWAIAQPPGTLPDGLTLAHSAIQSAKKYIDQNAEPASYIATFSASLIGIITKWEADDQTSQKNRMTDSGKLANKASSSNDDLQSPSTTYSTVYNTIRDGLSYRSGFIQYNPQEAAINELVDQFQASQSSLFSLNNGEENQNLTENDRDVETEENQTVDDQITTVKEKLTHSSEIPSSMLFWLRDPAIGYNVPITDLYEQKLFEYLTDHPGCTYPEVDTFICQLFKGLFTPPTDFIRVCLGSYAARKSADDETLYIRFEDTPEERQADIANAEQSLINLGTMLGFKCENLFTRQSRKYIAWQDVTQNIEYRFFITPTAAISDLVLYGEQPSLRAYIIIPGSRANIIFHKLRHDPRLGKAFNQITGCWRFLKFRHLRSLADNAILNRDTMDQVLNLDPLTYSRPQLWLI